MKNNASVVLMYHSIGTPVECEVGNSLYCVSVERFREQLGYISGVIGSSGHHVTITFDDGDLTNYTQAYPVLKELGLKAYFFILVGRVGTTGYLSWDQIKELKDNGMIIGSHGMTHKIMAAMNNSELDYEISESKKILEDKLKTSIDYFSIPRGFYNDLIIKKLKDSGYKVIFTSDQRDKDGFKVGRIPVKGSWSLQYFISVLDGKYIFKDSVIESIKGVVKSALGSRGYDKLRSILIRK